MITLKRLNDDSSWFIQIGSTAFLLDPWTDGDDVNLAPWFSTQKLIGHIEPLKNLPGINFVLISHPFSDHCSEQSLTHLPKATTVYAAPAAMRRIQRMRHFDNVESLASWQQESRIAGSLEIIFFASEKIFDLTHNAIFIRDKESGQSIFYAPHGYVAPLSGALHSKLISLRPTLLMTTFREYKLPLWLGGTVNLGSGAAIDLAQFLRPSYLVRTHDGVKHEAGLVTKVAIQSLLPDPDLALKTAGLNVTYIDVANTSLTSYIE